MARVSSDTSERDLDLVDFEVLGTGGGAISDTVFRLRRSSEGCRVSRFCFGKEELGIAIPVGNLDMKNI
jgi:hypothetical protein